MSVLPVASGTSEPDINILSWRQEGTPNTPDHIVMVVFVRKNIVQTVILQMAMRKY